MHSNDATHWSAKADSFVQCNLRNLKAMQLTIDASQKECDSQFAFCDATWNMISLNFENLTFDNHDNASTESPEANDRPHRFGTLKILDWCHALSIWEVVWTQPDALSNWVCQERMTLSPHTSIGWPKVEWGGWSGLGEGRGLRMGTFEVKT